MRQASCIAGPALCDVGRQAAGDGVFLKTSLLMVVTAALEILGCYLPYLWLRKGHDAWLLIPTAVCLAMFA